MKKFSIITAMLAVCLGFSSCEDDKDPVYHQPAEGSFYLNTPALANQYFDLAANDCKNTIEFTTSQPDYGFVASVNYSMQMALVENATDEEVYDLTTTMPTSAVMNVKCSEVAEGFCKLHGYETDDDWNAAVAEGVTEHQVIYFRAVASLPGQDETRIVSNWVKMTNITPYFAVPQPGYIYLIGQCGGWKEPAAQNEADLAAWRLFEKSDNIGSKIYSGVFEVPAGQAMFRFYTKLTGWDGGDSWGYQVEDSATDFEFTDGKFESEIVNGKGSFNFPDWAGGEMTIIVNMASAIPTVTVIAGAAEVVDPTYIYMVGNNAGWAEPSEVNEAVYNNWRLSCDKGDGIYTGTFAMNDIPDDMLYCRFYQALSGWGAAQWASDPAEANEDGNLLCEQGVEYNTVSGEGCFMFAGVNGNTVTVVLDTNAGTVMFDFE